MRPPETTRTLVVPLETIRTIHGTKCSCLGRRLDTVRTRTVFDRKFKEISVTLLGRAFPEDPRESKARGQNSKKQEDKIQKTSTAWLTPLGLCSARRDRHSLVTTSLTAQQEPRRATPLTSHGPVCACSRRPCVGHAELLACVHEVALCDPCWR